jgi:hypothetical protein
MFVPYRDIPPGVGRALFWWSVRIRRYTISLEQKSWPEWMLRIYMS